MGRWIMKKWIRWPGLGAFLGIVILFALFWFLLVDRYVEHVIEKYGTRAVGAKVELAGADLSLFPAGLELAGIQVTDPDEPMTNAVEIARVSLSLDALNLLRRKVIIEEMALEGVRLNTPRKTSGALVLRPDAATTGRTQAALKKWLNEKMALPPLEIRDAREILKNERLESVELVQSLRAEIQSEKEDWHKLLLELPGREVFDKYQGRIQKLKSSTKGPVGGMLSAAGDAVALQEDIKRDLNAIKQAQRDFDRKMSSIRVRLDQAANAPLKDIQRLKEKYSLSTQGISNMSRLIFGPKVGGWTQKAIDWYNKLSPILGKVKKEGQGPEPEAVKPMRGRGVDVRFKEHSPLPDFLIREAKASVELQSGNLAGEIKSITPDQDILGTPLIFEFSGKKMKGFDSISIDGAMDRVIPSRSKDTVNAKIVGYEARDVTLSDNPELPVNLEHGRADLQLSGLISGDKIAANLTAAVKAISLKTSLQDGSGLLARAIGSALSEVSGFTVKAAVTGSLEEYDIKLSSDLDRVLQSVAGKAVQKQAAIFENDLKREVFAKVNGPLGEARSSLVGFDSIEKELTSRLNLGNSLLASLGAGSTGSGFKLPF
jgi:uncharacterized protein (TIGR03545 family)